MSRDATQRLMDLFAGFAGASGTHGVPEKDPEGLKWNIKRTAKTLRQPVTPELWEQHVAGKRPLGVIPIREDNSCSWGSIDFDEYDVDLIEMIKRVETAKYPLVPCRSKSGGLHLFLFLKEPEPAADVQGVLRDAAASLGMADCEIFPKQTRVLVERNDLGSWMVMPYFGDTFGGKLQNQHGLKKTGSEMTMAEFVSFAEKKQTTVAEFAELCRSRRKTYNGTGKGKASGKNEAQDDFANGPPCLQHLTSAGIQKDGRKRTLFMMALYYKRADPENWKARLERANQMFFKPPLPTDEVSGIIRSVSKKDYEYTCKEEPMRSFCDSVLCRTRKFGIGKGGEFPVITGLSKLDTDPPIWFADVLGERLELTTEDLQMYQRFHRACMNRVNKSFKTMKQDAWLSVLSEAMDRLVLIEAPPDAGTGGKFQEHLEEFLTNRARAERVEDLMEGRPWESIKEQRYYFTIKAFEKYLQQEGVRDLKRGQILTKIRAMGGGAHFININNERGIRTWYVPSDKIEGLMELTAPKIDREEQDI